MYQLVALDIVRQRAERAERRALASALGHLLYKPERAPRHSRDALTALRRDLAAAFAAPRGGGNRLEGRLWVACC